MESNLEEKICELITQEIINGKPHFWGYHMSGNRYLLFEVDELEFKLDERGCITVEINYAPPSNASDRLYDLIPRTKDKYDIIDKELYDIDSSIEKFKCYSDTNENDFNHIQTQLRELRKFVSVLKDEEKKRNK